MSDNSKTYIDFMQIKGIDDSIKRLVFGYIHEISNIIDCPDLICFVILYYYHVNEYFTLHSEYMSLNKQQDIISTKHVSTTIYGNVSATVYGNINIYGDENSLFVWTFKLLDVCEYCNITVAGKSIYVCPYTIGLDSSNKTFVKSSESNFACRVTNINKFYAFSIEDEFAINLHSNNGDKRVRVKIHLYEGDIIKLQLNTKLKTLKYYINDNNNIRFKDGHKEIMFDTIDFNDKVYNLAINVTTDSEDCQAKLHRIQLVSFSQTILD
eukprot:308462_1